MHHLHKTHWIPARLIMDKCVTEAYSGEEERYYRNHGMVSKTIEWRRYWYGKLGYLNIINDQFFLGSMFLYNQIMDRLIMQMMSYFPMSTRSYWMMMINSSFLFLHCSNHGHVLHFSCNCFLWLILKQKLTLLCIIISDNVWGIFGWLKKII